MSRSPLEYLRHMSDEAIYLEREAGILDKTSMLSDERAKRALTRSIAIIGEAAKKVPEEMRVRHPELETLEGGWCWLVARPHPWRRQLWVKVRKFLASQVWSDMNSNRLTTS
jgi:hypothetical protein